MKFYYVTFDAGEWGSPCIIERICCEECVDVLFQQYKAIDEEPMGDGPETCDECGYSNADLDWVDVYQCTEGAQ